MLLLRANAAIFQGVAIWEPLGERAVQQMVLEELSPCWHVILMWRKKVHAQRLGQMLVGRLEEGWPKC